MNFHTIDPLILETLNLNQRRMNHILDILHGKQKNKPKQTKQINKKHSFQNSLRQDSKNYSTLLPDISRRNQTIQTHKHNSINDKKYNTIENSLKRRSSSLRQNKNNHSQIETKQQHNKQIRNKKEINQKRRSNTIDQSVTPVSLLNYQKDESKSIKHPKNSLSAVRSKFRSQKNIPLQTPSSRGDLSPKPNYNQDSAILEESLINKNKSVKNIHLNPNNKRVKTKQMINDYMNNIGLKKSKSMMLNPKDIYRMEIQKIVAQLTPIQKLQEAEKKMKRIKKRHQNLKQFDQKYYSRLNQMDLVLM